jgi:hypothetical protein
VERRFNKGKVTLRRLLPVSMSPPQFSGIVNCWIVSTPGHAPCLFIDTDRFGSRDSGNSDRGSPNPELVVFKNIRNATASGAKAMKVASRDNVRLALINTIFQNDLAHLRLKFTGMIRVRSRTTTRDQASSEQG